MPRGESIAPPAERELTVYNILNDFNRERARIYKGIPALRVYAKKAEDLPYVHEYPYYEHPEMYGDDVYSILVYVGLERALKKQLGQSVAAPGKDGQGEIRYVPDFKWEHVYLDLYLTPHEKAAFDLGDPHNTSNLFRSLDREFRTQEEGQPVVIHRGGVHETVVNLSYEPVAVDFEHVHTDIWPSGPNKGKYLADLDEEFLKNTIRLGSGKNASAHLQDLRHIAEAELNRRKNETAKAEEKTSVKGGKK